MTDGWILRFDDYDAATEGIREALCTVGNGYLGTRGAAAECDADAVHYPGCYAAGVYNRLSSVIAGQPVTNESLVNAPNWLPVTFRIDDGDWFHIDKVEILAYRQTFDLRTAVLSRSLTFRDQGRTTVVEHRRFADMSRPHVCALETTIIPQDWSGRLEISSCIDAGVRNTLVARYRDLPSRHFDVSAWSQLPDGHRPDASDLLEVRTTESGIGIAVAARSRLTRDRRPVSAQPQPVTDGQRFGRMFRLAVEPGSPITLEKVVVVYTSRDRAISTPSQAAGRELARLGGFDNLLVGHRAAWRVLWRRLRVTLVAHEDVQRIIRLHLVHLLQTVSPHTEDLDAGVPARGLHGEAYRGHIFWDELFVFPVLNLRLPTLTRSLLRYRHRRLPEARAAALRAGLRGAMFPWQSGSDGREESQQLHLNPLSGRWQPDPSHRQQHIGIAVAYNVWQYYQATADWEFLAQYGAELLVEIARFWSATATYDQVRRRFVIRGVIGPDEYHTGYPDSPYSGVDNNAYTNVMVAWVMRRAIDALDLLSPAARADLADRLSVRAEERRRWLHLSQALLVPFHDGIISQFDGYQNLAELDWYAYRARYEDIARLDRILEAEGDDVNRYQVSKQADTLMLFFLLSAEELGDVLTGLGYQPAPDLIPRTIEYYLARTSHGSTLSAVVHAWVLARAHRDQAAQFFHTALMSDVADVQRGTTKEGIHLAAMAGSVDLLQRCFAGLELRGDRLVVNPLWPTALGVLEFDVWYRHHPLRLRIKGNRIDVTAQPGPQSPITLVCRGEEAVLHAGATVRFPLAG